MVRTKERDAELLSRITYGKPGDPMLSDVVIFGMNSSKKSKPVTSTPGENPSRAPITASSEGMTPEQAENERNGDHLRAALKRNYPHLYE